jgi:hypothetical protein
MIGLLRSLDRGVRNLGGWRFWIGFWCGELFMNLAAEYRRQRRWRERAERDADRIAACHRTAAGR